MNGALPLILSTEPVTSENRNKAASPHVAVVYADGDGHCRPARPTRREARKNWTRYEVDLSDHRRKARLDSTRLLSRGDLYAFDAEVDVGFRVTNENQIVRRNVADALAVVYGYLVQAFWPVTRSYEIEQAPEAEAALNAMFRTPVELDEGITIYRCFVLLTPDRAAQEHLRAIDAAGKSMKVGQVQHQADVAAAAHQRELDAAGQQARLDAEDREHKAMADRAIDVRGLIQAHLARHPDQTAYALEVLSRHELAVAAQQDVNDKRSMDLFRYMVEQGMVQSADLRFLRDQAVGRVQEITSPAARQVTPPPRPAELPAGAPSARRDTYDDPLPVEPSVLSLKPESAAGQARPGGSPSTVPVYLVVDESPGDPGYFTALNTAIRTLPAELAADASVIDAVRLALIGYAGEVKVRMPLNELAAESHIPGFSPGTGSRLSAVFEHLRGCIVEDVARNKKRGVLVGRPVVYLLCASATDGDPEWRAAYQRLTDKADFRAAPNFVACGLGEADPGVIAAIAAQPQSSGWIADPGLPLSEAAARYAAFVKHSVAALGRAHATGSTDADFRAPDGFRSAGKPA